MEKKTNIWNEKFKDLIERDFENPEEVRNYQEKEKEIDEATEKLIKKTAVDYYSMKVPFNSL